MSNLWLYEVTAEFDDAAFGSSWADWIRREHIADVISAGALNGRLLRIADKPNTYVVQYDFESEAALKTYLETQSPRLREVTARRFDPAKIRYSRRMAEILK